MESCIQLPIAKPLIVGYLHHAHPLLVLFANENNMPWFFSHYIQLYSFKADIPFVGVDHKIDFFSYFGQNPPYPRLTTHWMDKDFFESNNIDAVEFTINCIRRGYYVEATLNEFHLPNKVVHNTMDLPHQNFVYGCDFENRVFKCFGFNKNSSFTTIDIAFDDFRKAFYQSPFAGIAWMDADHAIDTTGWGQRIDRALIASSIRDYLDGANSALAHQVAGAKFGMDVYNDVKDILVNMPPDRADIRLWHIIWEHKRCMKERVSFLQKHGLLTSDCAQLQDSAAEIEKLSLVARNVVLKYRLTGDVRLTGEVCKTLDTLLEKEKPMLENVFRQLETLQ